MPLFFPDTVAPRDPAGWGRWLLGHWLEHQQMVTKAAALAVPATIPQIDILKWSDEPQNVVLWLNAHYQIHQALRQPGAIGGIDLSLVDFSKPDDFLIWQDEHSTEHAELRAFYGITT